MALAITAAAIAVACALAYLATRTPRTAADGRHRPGHVKPIDPAVYNARARHLDEPTESVTPFTLRLPA